MLSALFTSLILLLAETPVVQPSPTTAVDLSGKVLSTDGNAPIIGATVVVYSASPKPGKGATAAAASSSDDSAAGAASPDIGKSATSDPEGKFTVAGVDSSMSYQFVVSADGFRPILLKKVDPSRGAVTAKLKPIPKDLDPAMTLRGRVVDPNGNPVVGAKIEPFGVRDGTERWWGGFGGMSSIAEPVTFTDANGEFLLIAKKPSLLLDVRVSGRGVAPQLVAQLDCGETVHDIAVGPGATMTGRLVKDGQPLAGAVIKLAQRDRGVETYVGDFTATTAGDGRFTIANLKPDENYRLIATMKSIAPKGAAVPMTECASTSDGTSVDLGDITAVNGVTVSGQLVCSDGKAVPVGTRVTLSRWETSDPQEVKTTADGKFEFTAVPENALFQLSATMTGYHVSSENQSYEPANARWLLGLVDGEITDLRVQMDPGPNEQGDYRSNKWNELQTTRLTGVPAQ